MKIGIIGTGIVGQTLADGLLKTGHDVVMGTRDPAQTMARTERDRMGGSPFPVWLAERPAVRLATFGVSARHGDVVINATGGEVSLAALEEAGAGALGDRILIDASNPLDFSHGMPPSLTVCNTDSTGEQIQRAFPALRVVKALNTMTAALMTNPRSVAGGQHDLFLCGNDAAAKVTVSQLLRTDFGWEHIIDLGDITGARGMEMVLPLWLRLMTTTGSPLFNFRVVR